MSEQSRWLSEIDRDVWDLRELDRERFGGIVVHSQITKAGDRCVSQTCCDGFLGVATQEDWAHQASANDDDAYRNGIRRLMGAYEVIDV